MAAMMVVVVAAVTVATGAIAKVLAAAVVSGMFASMLSAAGFTSFAATALALTIAPGFLVAFAVLTAIVLAVYVVFGDVSAGIKDYDLELKVIEFASWLPSFGSKIGPVFAFLRLLFGLPG